MLGKYYDITTNSQVTEIADKIYLSGTIERKVLFEYDSLLYKKIGESYVKDDFIDEQYLLIEDNDSSHIFTGCSHSGVENILIHASENFPKPVKSLVGGFHLFRADEEAVERTAQAIEQFGVENIYTGHCTGFKPFMRLNDVLKNRPKMTKSGLTFEL